MQRRDADVQVVDREVSVAKFNREVERFRELARDYARQGVLLLNAEFPRTEFLFVAPHLTPIPVLFAARLDFTNYDVWPPSVRLIHPITRDMLSAKEVTHPFLRRLPPPANFPRDLPPIQPASPFQWESPESLPYLCMPGVREYHDHSAHTNDPWLLHRKLGEGTLAFIVDKLLSYGVVGIAAYRADLQIRISGFQLDPNRIPE